MDNQTALPESVPLLEGWMVGALLYTLAMQQVADHPPANDE